MEEAASLTAPLLTQKVSHLVWQSAPPNPSIEGTCNIWLRQLSPAPHVKR